MTLSKLCYVYIYNLYHVICSVVTDQKQLLFTYSLVVLVGPGIFLKIKVGPGLKKVEKHCFRQYCFYIFYI